MHKFFSAAAVIATGALFTLPAAAADLHVAKSSTSVIRISVANKPVAQIRQEIGAAVAQLCGADLACADESRMDAERQLREIDAKTHPRIEVARNDPSTVRISLKGKTRAQVEQEIDVAAASVCKSVPFGDQRECEVQASGDAKRRLAEAGQLNRLAMN